MTQRVPRAALGAWAVRETASYHLQRIAQAFSQAELDLMVLKGMWLQAYAYQDPDERPFADLDLLVRRSELAAAEAVLVRLGYRLQIDAPGDVARLYVSREGFQIDLHYDLFPDGLFTLRGEHLFLRGLQDTRLVGVPVRIPDPYDGFAHLVGHFAKGRHGPSDTKLLRDFEELARAFQLLPSRAAAHLVAGGLRRAGLYALQFHRDPDSFASRTRRALPADALGHALVGAIGVPRRAEEEQRVSDRLFAFALDHGLPQGVMACGRRVRALWREGGAQRVWTPAVHVHQGSSVG
ncbi:MAG: nucleotidyltransferase family protein [Sandaracinaceae bacterium]|nr:nucleotidyltransferase family protein [Sandaracinaceae bacterium]